MAIVDGLITLADAKLSLGKSVGDTSSDADIENYIEAATPVIENITGPMIARNRTYVRDGGGVIVVDPFNSIVSVTESGVAVTDFVANGTAGIVTAGTSSTTRAFKAGVGNVVVVASVGSATIPPNIQLAARELVRFWWQLGRQGNRPAFGNEMPSEVVPSGFAVPRRVIELCEPHRSSVGFA